MTVAPNTDSRFVSPAVDWTDERLVTMLSMPQGGKPGRLCIEATAEANRRGLEYGHFARHNAWLRSTNLADYAVSPSPRS